MRRKSILAVVVGVLLALLADNSVSMGSLINDGQPHIIDYTFGRFLRIRGDGTHVTVVDGGYIPLDILTHDNSCVVFTGGSVGRHFYAYDSSHVDFYGGSVNSRFFAKDHSRVNFFGGTIGFDFVGKDFSQVNITGGVIGPQLYVEDMAQVSVSGGFIEQYITANDTSTITLYGSEFNYGYGQIPDSTGRLTGILASGETIDNTCYIRDNARIILVPEPTTLLLLGLGGLPLLRKRRTL